MGQRIDRTARVGHLGGQPRRQRSLPAADWRELSTLNSLFTVLFRGNAATSDLNPVVKDDVLLTEFGHALVHAELEPLGVNQ